MEYAPPPFFKRGPSLFTRLSFFAVLSLVLLYADARFHYMESMRRVVAIVLYPLQQLADTPGQLTERVGSFFVTQSALQRENERLARENFLNATRLQTQEALLEENRHLRELLDMRKRTEQTAVGAEILYFARDPFGRKVIVDKGTAQNIQEGAAVVDDTGLVGQVTRAFPWTAEISLITDREQVVPVQVVRNGLRAVVFGVGYDGALELRYMPVNADIENGDVLVTSGIDGVYPAGLPVAVVSNIERNAAYPFARITCTPTAGVNRHKQVLVLSRLSPLPEYPAEAATPAKPRSRAKARKVE